MRDGKEIESFASEELARKRFFSFSPTVAGHGAKLVRPDGTEDGGRVF
jgi:hypothetical protein